MYYEHVYKQVQEGTWKPAADWWGIETGVVDLAPYGQMVPDDVRQKVDAMKAAMQAKEFVVFKGPLTKQDGTVAAQPGQTLTDQEMLSMDYFIEGVRVAFRSRGFRLKVTVYPQARRFNEGLQTRLETGDRLSNTFSEGSQRVPHNYPHGTGTRPQAAVAELDMQFACLYAYGMKKNIQIRNVPDDLHRTLKARAALAGMSLSDYLLQEARRLAERPTLEELRQRLHQRQPVAETIDAAALIREARGPLPGDDTP